MKTNLKRLLAPVVLVCGASAAMAFPVKPVHIVVPYSAGSGPLEAAVRLVADELAVSWKQPVVVEYKPGGATTIGAAAVAQAPADGHTLFVNAGSFLITAQLMSNLPYNPKTAFAPVTMLHSYPHVLIAPPDSKGQTAQDLVNEARKTGDKMSYGSFGNASSGHLATERLKKTFDFNMLHVPYKGGDGLKDLIAGRLDAMLFDLPAVVPFAESGKVKPLAVGTQQRHRLLPNVPTFEEALGKPFTSRSWFGILVRADTPADIRQQLNRDIVAVLNKPEVKQKLEPMGIDLQPTTADEFAQFMNEESERIAEAVAFSGARME